MTYLCVDTVFISFTRRTEVYTMNILPTLEKSVYIFLFNTVMMDQVYI